MKPLIAINPNSFFYNQDAGILIANGNYKCQLYYCLLLLNKHKKRNPTIACEVLWELIPKLRETAGTPDCKSGCPKRTELNSRKALSHLAAFPTFNFLFSFHCFFLYWLFFCVYNLPIAVAACEPFMVGVVFSQAFSNIIACKTYKVFIL